jgi:hypoxanthine phosphoribosyltransferase
VTDPTPVTDRPAFAHASEAELARILDFYDVRWAYEPDTFPIAWNLDGEVIESFSPDFYLPDVELYVELTTLKQKLVRKKNRKLRRLRELYPDIRIKLFYARDFRMLLLKFGRLALHEELSGTTGQSTPPRPATAALGEVMPSATNEHATAAADDRRATDDPPAADETDADAAETLLAGVTTLDAPGGPGGRRDGRGRRRGKRRRRPASHDPVPSIALADPDAGTQPA